MFKKGYQKIKPKVFFLSAWLVCAIGLQFSVHGQSNAPTTLINIDFNSGTSSAEVGFAATGQTSGDFWNLISPTPNGAAANLLYADKSVSGAGISVTNAPGAYGNGVVADLMYQGYVYPYDGGSIGIGVTNLAVGNYDIYVYGHGPANEGNSTYTLGADNASQGSLTTAGPGWNSAVWQEGVQYVVFRGVQITNSAQNISLVVSPAASTYAVISGIQIASSTPVGPTAPVIASQPVSQTVFAGANVTFGVIATGTSPFGYQWSFNGTNLSSATNSTLTLLNVQATDAGNYAVSVSNSVGSLVSSNAVLTINQPVAPTITTQPHSLTVPVGASATFTVAATGTAPLTYQWRLNGSNLFGATRTSISMGAQATNAGNYSVMVANSVGSVLSTNALLTVTGAAPSITAQPQNRSVGVGAAVSFAVSATGSPTLFYQWKFNGGNLAGATRSILTLSNVQTTNAGTYAVVVTNAFGLATSTNALLTVTSAPPVAPTIVSQPQSLIVTAGQTANFGVSVSGTAPISYQWNFNGSNIVGATRISLSLSNAQPVNAGIYAVIVSNTAGSVTSSNAALTVTIDPPVIVSQPVSQTVMEGANVAFSVTATGNQPLTYQWNFNGTEIAGATGSTLALNNVQPANAGNYYVTLSNPAGVTNSVTALLTVNVPQPPTPGLNLIDVDFNAGTASAEVGFAAIGQTTNDYWNLYSRDDGHGGYLAFGGVGNLKFADGSLSGAGLTVANAPGAWGNGASDAMYQGYLYPFDGGNIVVNVTNLDAGNYEIYLYGHGAADNQNSTYSLSVGGASYGSQTTAQSGWNSAAWQEGVQYVVFHNVAVTNAGAAVQVIVSPEASSYAVIAGMQIALTTAPTPAAPVIVGQPQSKVVPAGGSVAFNVLASGSSPVSYQWAFNGNNIIGATDVILNLSNVQAGDAGNYSVTVSNALGSAISSNASLTVTAPVAVSQLIDVDFDAGTASAKTGFAATGLSAGDFWNLYSRDDGHGGYKSFGGLGNLRFADGSISQAGLTIANAPGAWGNGVADGMYQGYLYPFDGGNIVLNVTNLDAGTYDIYVYGHAPGNDGNSTYTLSLDGTSFGSQTTALSGWNSTTWQEGAQYVVFRGVTIANNGSVVKVVVSPQASSYAVIAGMQIAQVSAPTPSAPNIVTQPTSQAVMTGADVVFSVGVKGTSPLSFQWHYNGSNIVGATSASLALNHVQLSSAGNYSVTVANALGSVDSSNAVLTVTPFNHAPVANSQTFVLNENASTAINLTATDADGDPLAYTLVSTTAHGTLSGTIPNFTYLPGSNYAGADSLSFKVNDGQVDSAIATVSIIVRQDGSKPLINVDFDAGTASAKVGVAATGQSANDFWNLYSRDDGHGGYLALGGLKNLKLADGSISVAGLTIANAPGAWGNGSSDPMYQGYLYPFNGGNITVTLTNLDLGIYDIYLYGHGPANDGNSTYQLNVAGTSYGSLTTAQAGWNSVNWQEGVQYVVFRGVTIANGGQAATITVLPGASGYAILAGMQIASSTAATNPPVNHTPVANDQTVTLAANGSASITVTGSDVDGDELTYSLVSLPSHGTLTGITPHLTYQPTAGYSGSDSFTFKVNDGHTNSAAGTVSLNVLEMSAGGLIDVDFGAGTSTGESGFAAIGQTTNDFWNFYSRDDGQGGWLTFGTLGSLKFVDGTLSGAGMTVVNAPGYWANGSSDSMYNGYIYPLDGGSASVIITNLATGQYDFYVYGLDTSYQLNVDANNYGSKSTANAAIVNPVNWQEGVQYVVFKDVAITNAAQGVTLTIRAGVNGYALLSGLQIVQTSTNSVQVPPTTTDTNAPTARIAASPVIPSIRSTNQFVISANGSNATVILDGSLSSDPTNALLTYTWSESTNAPFATGALITNSFDLGVQVITLTVNNGTSTGKISIAVEVLDKYEGLFELELEVLDSGLTLNEKRPLFETLSQVYPPPTPGQSTGYDVNQLVLFQDKVRSSVAPINPALADHFITFAQRLIDAANAS
ncbi:beta strand repeat-containing protein [Pedosphaera parvula]|uniref:Immunoglobulin I-set domain protein n=1 Tax=Pedosphaera parvula (strain Ellin514) TaxID=320771 RepID=B9XIN7_PEDPL|nr:immunoglobulin domain-containing protein [Pedosphaera parvula]EEF60300.1 Immunoglobulin I-set domain protein [Pedosphaera parvula Ellin514]